MWADSQFGKIERRDMSQLHPLPPLRHTWQRRSPKEGNSAYLGYSHPSHLPSPSTGKSSSCERWPSLGLDPSWGVEFQCRCDSNGAEMEARQGGRTAASQACHCSLASLGICCLFSGKSPDCVSLHADAFYSPEDFHFNIPTSC